MESKWYKIRLGSHILATGNEALRDALQYAPERAYTDREGTNRVYDEMWTADWWWDTQVRGLKRTGQTNSH